MNELPELQTARLRLVIPGAAAAGAQARFYRENVQHLTPWEPPITQAYLDAAQRAADLEAQAEMARVGSSYRFLIYRKEDSIDGELLGHVNLHNVIRGIMQACILGYNLSESAQGCGYMHEACEAVIAFAYDTLGLHRIGANYMPHNERSAAVLRRLGFSIEGTARSFLYIDGAWRDHILTARINPHQVVPA